ncbi:DUF6049 family protein [Microbacterium soli]|uniref:DUF6049 family protein n=1 Tax=Microbacterium soli TaxID=446075 RepID=A0ABP7N339_9MICO
MTAISPRDGSRQRARRLLSRLAAVLVVGSLALGSVALGSAPAASAADDEDAAAEDPTVELSISAGTGARIDAAGPLVGTVTIVNRTESALSAGTTSFEVSPSPLADGAALDAWLDEGVSSGEFRTVAVESTPAIDAGATADVSTVADLTELGALAPGVYPMLAHLTGVTADDADGTVWNPTASSVLVVTGPEAQSVGVLVPVTATPEDGALLSAKELTELTSPDGRLTAELDAVTGTAAILAVDPAIAASIRALGDRAPTTAVDWIDALERLPNDVFALQFGDADLAVQSQAGLEEQLTAPDLTALLQPADFPLSTPSPTRSGPDAPTPEPQLPPESTLSEISGVHGGLVWPRPGITPDDLARFDDYLGERTTTILPSTSFETVPPATHVEVAGHSVLVTATASSARLSAAAELADPSAVERDLAAAAGHLFFETRATPTVLVGLERSETRSPIALRQLLTAFASPAVRLSGLQAAKPASASLVTTADATRPAALTTMLDGEARMRSFSSVLEEPALLMAPERIRMLRAIAVGLDDDGFTAAAADRADHVRDVLASVAIQRPKPVQLIAAAAPLPVWVRNDLPWPVHVMLHSRPSDPRLDIASTTRVEAAGDGATRVDVPITARVASGQVDVEFRLTSPTGVAIGAVESAEVTLRADWEGIGLGIGGGVIALLLVFGLIRTVRRKRHAAADAEDAAGTTDTADVAKESE